ncbi:hypothetical protein HOG16_01600 [Candidatus Woesearchaeota archaeon]|jgi:hypothetical protein|nr:hypothetical protein [Candidatus Woesearchaeota archaeon]MBT4322269.1 hypothetical protein [Candidatus Woesearchaeota archaeon]
MEKQIKKEDKIKKIISEKKIKVSHRFVSALSLVSILGFIGIVSYALFNFNLNNYVEALLMLTIGTGLILEANINSLKSINVEGLTKNNFTHLTTMIIGGIAVLAGIFSFPGIRIENPSFLAVKGIISIIAIIFIIIQTWVIE